MRSRISNPLGSTSTADGLGSKTVGADASVMWTFRIDASMQRGSGTVIATCGNASTQHSIPNGTPGLSR